MLVVPDMEPQMEAVENGFVKIHPLLLADAHNAMVNLPCQECPFREVDHEGVATWARGKSPSLMLEFTVEDSLLLANGRQIFPPVNPGPLRASQQLEDGQVSEPMIVGYALEMMPMETTDKSVGMDLYDVRLTILDLERHPIAVDTVAIKLVQDSAGELYIAKTEIEKTKPSSNELSWEKCDGKATCLRELAIGRVRGLLAAAKDRVAAAAAGKPGRKGCHGKHRPTEEMAAWSKFEKGHHNGGHHHHHHPHSHGALARTSRRIVHFIIIPALVGILAGVAASAIGMLIGQAVIFVWRRYRCSSPQETRTSWEHGESCEKQGLIEDNLEISEEEALPQYTESASTRNSIDKN